MRKNCVYYGKISKDKLGYSKKDKYKFFIVVGEYNKKYLCLLISSRPYPYKDDIPLERCIIRKQQLAGLQYDSFINVHGPIELEESDVDDLQEIQQLERKLIEGIKRVADKSPNLWPPYRDVIRRM